MRVIARGEVGNVVAEAGETALGPAHGLPGRNELGTERGESGAHRGVVGVRRRSLEGPLRNQFMVQQVMAQHFIGQAADPARHRTEHDDARAGLLLQRGHRLADVIEMLREGPVQQHHIGLHPARQRQNLVVDRPTIRGHGDVGIEGRNARRGGQLRDPEIAGLLRLAQAGHQRARGGIAPHQDQRPAIAIDAVFRERGVTSEIEQAGVDPPLLRLRPDLGHGADLRRQTRREAAVVDDGRHPRSQSAPWSRTAPPA